MIVHGKVRTISIRVLGHTSRPSPATYFAEDDEGFDVTPLTGQSTERFQSALDTQDRESLRRDQDERHRLIMDRGRLRDDYDRLMGLRDGITRAQNQNKLKTTLRSR
jgi:hypothetical protein